MDSPEEDDYSPAFIHNDDAIEVIEIQPRNTDGEAAETFDDMVLEEVENTSDTNSILSPDKDDSIQILRQHKDAVLCACMDNNKLIAVTGGQDDTSFVWDLSTGSPFFECFGHSDSVSCVGISNDGSLVATGDMNGLLKVWNVEEKKNIWSFEMAEIEWLRWHKAVYVLLVGTSVGDVWLFNVATQECKTFASHGFKCTVGDFLPDGKRAATGYDDGSVKLWDLKAGTAVSTISCRGDGHSSTVTCVACHPTQSLILSTSTDMSALLISSESGKVLSRFNCRSGVTRRESENEGDTFDNDDSVECAAFSFSNNYAATGTLSGILTIWDLLSQNSRYEFHHQGGVVKLGWHPSLPIIFSCSLDGCVYVWNVKEGCLIHRLQGHTAPILDMDVSRDGKTIITASDDHSARLFNINLTKF